MANTFSSTKINDSLYSGILGEKRKGRGGEKGEERGGGRREKKREEGEEKGECAKSGTSI